MRPCKMEDVSRQLPPSPRLHAAARGFCTTEPKRGRRTQGGTVAATRFHRTTSNTFNCHKRGGRMRRAVQNSTGAKPLPLPFRHENTKSRKSETAAGDREDRPSFAISDFRVFAIKSLKRTALTPGPSPVGRARGERRPHPRPLSRKRERGEISLRHALVLAVLSFAISAPGRIARADTRRPPPSPTSGRRKRPPC